MRKLLFSLFVVIIAMACNYKDSYSVPISPVEKSKFVDSVIVENVDLTNSLKEAEDIVIEKELLYDKYTLEDNYPYKDTVRVFQWNKIKEKLAYIENFQIQTSDYGVIQNYKNRNKEAPLVRNFVRNEYTRVADTQGVERYQSVPLYRVKEYDAPIIYGRDGSVVRFKSVDTLDMITIEGISFSGIWDVPKQYLKKIADTVRFNHVVVVDVTNQNIATLERVDNVWKVRSMNPATTGRHKPPYAQETPTGIFLIQENKSKMYYYADGTTSIEGYAPYASRFTNGAYVHGVPVNNPKGKIIEYSYSLGTTPRSHMCVRNASSHAEFIYNWAKPMNALVVVID